MKLEYQNFLCLGRRDYGEGLGGRKKEEGRRN
jgi:hypothetical protein